MADYGGEAQACKLKTGVVLGSGAVRHGVAGDGGVVLGTDIDTGAPGVTDGVASDYKAGLLGQSHIRCAAQIQSVTAAGETAVLDCHVVIVVTGLVYADIIVEKVVGGHVGGDGAVA